MARLQRLPEQAIVDGFKGALDFYYWKGMPCVRKWPTWSRRDPWPDERSNQDSFGYAAAMWQFLPAYVQDCYNLMAAGTTVTGRDIFMRGYMRAGRP